MAVLPGLNVGISLDANTFIAETRRVDESVNRMARGIQQQTTVIDRSIGGLTGTLRSFAGGFAAAFSAQAIAGAVTRTFAWADALSELSDRVGINVEQLQRLQRAGELTNVSQQQISTSLEQFGRRLGEAARGEGELADALERSGISLRNQDGSLRTISAVFDDYVGAVANAGTEQEALALAVDGFGRSGAEMVTTIREMASSLNDFGVLTEQQIETLARYDDVITDLSQRSLYGFQIAVVEVTDAVRLQGAVAQSTGNLLADAFDNIFGTDVAGRSTAAARTTTVASVFSSSVSTHVITGAPWGPTIIVE